jgi:autotransporter-associated beta strand protein
VLFRSNGIPAVDAALVGSRNGGVHTNTLSGTLTLAATSNVRTFSGNHTLSITGKITGPGGLTVDRPAGQIPIIVLSNTANDYQGDTTMNGALLRLGASDVVPNGGTAGNVVLTGAALTGGLNLNGFSDTINGLSGGNGVVSSVNNAGAGASTLTVGDNNATSTFDGVIRNTSGALTLTKIGNGALTLTGANTYSGGTTLSAGTLNINSATAIGTGTFTIAGGTIDNTSGGAITLTNNNVQNWNGDFTFTGSNDLNLGTGAVTPNATRQVTANGGVLTVGGVIGGLGIGLTKAGAGVLLLGAANSYTGTTDVTAGTLRLGAANAINTGSAVSVRAAATLDRNGQNQQLNKIGRASCRERVS